MDERAIRDELNVIEAQIKALDQRRDELNSQLRTLDFERLGFTVGERALVTPEMQAYWQHNNNYLNVDDYWPLWTEVSLHPTNIGYVRIKDAEGEYSVSVTVDVARGMRAAYIERIAAGWPEDEHPESFVCPACESVFGVRWRGGDELANLGAAATFTRVDWYECEACGYKWSESYDHE